MSRNRIEGYNVSFALNGKTYVGVTAHNFDLQMKEKTSITKDDQGSEQIRIKGHTYTFGIDGIAEINETGDEATKIDRDTAIALTLAGQPISFIYTATGAKSYSGKIVITSYSEKSGADDELTYNVSCKSTAPLTPVV